MFSDRFNVHRRCKNRDRQFISLDGVAVCTANEELRRRENRIKVWSDNVVCIITEIPPEKEL